MARNGRLNPLPYHVGGNPSPTEMAYRAMRAAQGRKGDGSEVAGPEGGIEDSWRLAKARVLARGYQQTDLAATQAFPSRASVHLGVYEELLGEPRAATEQERREAVSAAFTQSLEAIIPAIREELQAIDSGIDVVPWDQTRTTYTQFGKCFASRLGDEIYLPNAPRTHALFPNFSSNFVLVVRWTGAPSGIPPVDKREQVERYLNKALPSWLDYSIQNGAGFYLDGANDSRLDITAFG